MTEPSPGPTPIPVDMQAVIRNLAEKISTLTVQNAQWEAAYEALAQAHAATPSDGATRD